MGNSLKVPCNRRDGQVWSRHPAERWLVERRLHTYVDVAENRLLKHFLGANLSHGFYGIRNQAQTELKTSTFERDIKRRRNWEDDETEHIDESRARVECSDMLAETLHGWMRPI